MWINREISSVLPELHASKPVLLITGARQTGKTSLCQEIFPQHSYVSLDLPRIAEEADESGEAFLANYGEPLIIDEVQYAPKLFRYLKHAVDTKRNANGRYILTGSQKFSLMSQVSESLAGRVSIVELHTLSLSELERSSNKRIEGSQLQQGMFLGGFPELHASDIKPHRFFGDYVATYLERDVRQAIRVQNLRDFDRFMRMVAIRTGQLLSMNSLAADLGVSPSTIKSWLSVLEASQIICLLEPYYNNPGKRIVKTPKLYFLDTGLACFLAGLRSDEDLRSSALLGPMFETLVLGQIIRWHTNRGLRPQVYFYRDHYGLEVDFVLPVGEKLKLYECKWAETPNKVTKAFSEMTKIFGEENILTKSIITPVRGSRRAQDGIIIEDCVDLLSLAT